MPARNTDTHTPGRTVTVLVRDADPADRADLREVVEAAYRPFGRVLPPAVFGGLLADVLDFDRHARRGQLLVAEVDGRIRGSAAFYPNSFSHGMGWPRGWVGGRALAVHPDARRQGAARALLTACEQRARILGARTFAFHTAGSMVEAIALYEGLGYCRIPPFDIDLTTHYGHPAGRPIMALAYRKNVSDAGPCRGSARGDHRRPIVARSRRKPR